MAPIESPQMAKPKKDKKDKSSKKRAREEEPLADTERKHKKSKSAVDTDAIAERNGQVETDSTEKKEKKKSKKDKYRHGEHGVTKRDKSEKKKSKKRKKDNEANGSMVPSPPSEAPAVATKTEDMGPATAIKTEETSPKKKKTKKERSATNAEGDPSPVDEPSEAVDKEDGKSPTNEHYDTGAALANQTQFSNDGQQLPGAPHPDPMDLDLTASAKPSFGKTHQPSDVPPNPQFPFFSQTVSLYEPLYPKGWPTPVTGCEEQHLRHLKNRYVPSLRGVLLDYEKVTFGPTPGRSGAATNDHSVTVVTSRNEFGGGFGWITADVKLFVPSRGAWMEGSVNLQTEGHIGVICFGKFNASIEARRLPPSWKWVSNEGAEDGFDETASVFTATDEHGVVRQMHSTGYWVDGDGGKVHGKVRFRIRDFDVGVSGTSTFLSLQGTMLDKTGEKKLVETEAREARERRAMRGARPQPRRAVPEISMTRFVDGEENQA